MFIRLRHILSGEYIRNVGWMAGAEIANRVIRLISTVVLARMFSHQDYGLMAIIYTLSDFFQVFTLRGGVGSKIIQADGKDVNGICDTAYWLNVITCSFIFLIQCFVAFLIPYFFPENANLSLPLIVFSFTYLAYPFFLIHLTLIQRESRFKIVAACNVVVSLVSNISIAILALLGLGIWSIVISLLLVTPIWIFFAWKYHPWRPPHRFSLKRWRDIIGFGSNLLINDLLGRVRANVDYLIVGKYLGIEALGMYYFAFNAGSGITINILNTFMSPLYPYICEVRSDYWQFRERYFSSLRKVSLVIVSIVLLQACLAPIYVPLVFGERWVPAIPVLVLVSLSVIPRMYGWASTLLLNAIDKTQISLRISLCFTTIFMFSIFAVVHNGINYVAAAVFLSHLLVLLPLTLWANRFALRKENFLSS